MLIGSGNYLLMHVLTWQRGFYDSRGTYLAFVWALAAIADVM